MKVSLFTDNLTKLATQALIIPVPEGTDEELPATLRRLIPKAAHQSFKGKLDEVLVVYPADSSIERLVLVGLGDGKGSRSGLELFRRSVATGVRQFISPDIGDIAIYLGSLSEVEYVTEAVLMTLLAPYKFTQHKSTKEDEERRFRSLTLVRSQKKSSQDLQEEMEQAMVIGQAIIQTRNLVNSPSNHLTPTLLAHEAREVAATSPSLSVTVWGQSELAKRNFNALLAVARGSHEEPQLITLDYQPSTLDATRSTLKTIVLVGKGVTFDAGGISLKPAGQMGDMFMDMAGGAAVIATLGAIAQLKLPVHVVGIIPATENMPSGTAMKPGDIVASRSGTTIEVLDTDAEGRMILADALDYAKEFKPDLLIDLATLTGAAMIALGEERAAIIGNNQPLVNQLLDAGERSGERMWQLPLDDDYRAHVKSEVADVNNVGKKKGLAGTIAGAAFLEKFVSADTPWVHIDIAGSAMRSEAGPYWPKGGSGWGVRLLVEFLRSLS